MINIIPTARKKGGDAPGRGLFQKRGASGASPFSAPRAIEMIPQSQDRIDEVAEFNPATGDIRYLSNAGRPEFSHETTRGFYSTLDGHFLAVFVVDGMIRLRVDSADYSIDCETETRFLRAASRNSLLLIDRERVVFRLEYIPRVVQPPLEVDHTPFVEEEDHDFALFVHNLLCNPKRRKVFIETNR
jgi:hypothetical protein